MARRKKTSSAEKLAKLRKKLDSTDLGGGGGGFWSPKQGRNTIRILPEVGDMEFFFQSVGRHHLGGGSDAKRIYCPSFTSEGELDCPICEMRNILYKQGRDGDKSAADMAGMLNRRRMYWMNIIDRSNEEAGPLVFTPGVTIMNAIVALIQDPDYGDITDELEGTDIVIERSGTGLDTEYQVLPKRLPSPLSEDDEQAEDWLSTARDLSYTEVSNNPEEDAELSKGYAIYLLPYDRTKAEFDAYFDLDEDEEDYEEEEEVIEVPKRKRRRSKPEPVEEVVEDEEEEEEEDEPDEVEQEVAERKTRRRVRRIRRK